MWEPESALNHVAANNPTREACIEHITAVFDGSNGDATKALYADLERRGPRGQVAMNLLRASKNSGRAKVYRGGLPGKGSYRKMAYERKNWAMAQLATVLDRHAEGLLIVWGWGVDTSQPKHSDVLYVDLPTGQVSFHTEGAGVGPAYLKPWDGVRGASVGRIIRWTAQIMEDTSC